MQGCQFVDVVRSQQCSCICLSIPMQSYVTWHSHKAHRHVWSSSFTDLCMSEKNPQYEWKNHQVEKSQNMSDLGLGVKITHLKFLKFEWHNHSLHRFEWLYHSIEVLLLPTVLACLCWPSSSSFILSSSLPCPCCMSLLLCPRCHMPLSLCPCSLGAWCQGGGSGWAWDGGCSPCHHLWFGCHIAAEYATEGHYPEAWRLKSCCLCLERWLSS